uniref:Uncharacterized protein n=1 Tax=Plectus sambesii TaxID=2011161 RepID=A0A914UMX6_9BILA
MIWTVFKVLCLSFAIFPGMVLSWIWDIYFYSEIIFNRTRLYNLSDLDIINDSNEMDELLLAPKQLNFALVVFLAATYIALDVLIYSVIKLYLWRFSKFQCRRFLYDGVHFGTPLILIWAGRKLIMPHVEFGINVVVLCLLFIVSTSVALNPFFGEYRKVLSFYELQHSGSNNRSNIPSGIVETSYKTYQMDKYVTNVLYGFVGVMFMLDASGTLWLYKECGEQFDRTCKPNVFFPFAVNVPMIYLLVLDILTSRHLPRTVLYIVQDRQRYVIVREYYCADLQICKLHASRVVDLPMLPPNLPHTQYLVSDYDQLPLSIRRQIRPHNSTTAA